MVPAGMRNSHCYANDFGWSREAFSGVLIAAEKCEGCCRSKRAHPLRKPRISFGGPRAAGHHTPVRTGPRTAQIAIQLCGPATIVGALVMLRLPEKHDDDAHGGPPASGWLRLRNPKARRSCAV